MRLTSESWLFHTPEAKDTNQNYLCTITCQSKGIKIIASLPQEFNIDSSAVYEESMAQALNNTPVGGAIAPFARIAGLQLVSQAMTAQIWQGSTEFSFNLPLVFQAETDGAEDVANKLSQLMSLTLPDELTPNGLLTAPGPSLNLTELAKNFFSGAKSSAALGLERAQNVARGFTAFAGDLVTGVGVSRSAQNGVDYTKSLNSGEWSSAENTTGVTADKDPGVPLLNAVKDPIQLAIGNHMLFDCVVITNVNQTHFVQPLASGTMSRVELTVGFKTFFLPTKKDLPKMVLNSTWKPSSSTAVTKNTTRVPENAKFIPPSMR